MHEKKCLNVQHTKNTERNNVTVIININLHLRRVGSNRYRFVILDGSRRSSRRIGPEVTEKIKCGIDIHNTANRPRLSETESKWFVFVNFLICVR